MGNLLDQGTQLLTLPCRKEAILEAKHSASHGLRIPRYRVGDTDHGALYIEHSAD